MKIKYLLLTALLAMTIYAQAMAGCGSCEAAKHSCPDDSCGVTAAKDSCPEGTCAETEAAHDHEEHGHEGHAHAKADKKEEPAHEDHKAATLNTSALKTLLDSGVPLVVLDARSGKYDDGMRIPGAKSLNADSKPEEIAKVIPGKEALVVTYCSNLKCPASDKLYKHLKSLGYTNVIEYPEGIQGWKEAGLKVKPAK